ncbi:unnamed protein product [Darwinula stevensoni]|uniref:DUF1279 domain-containing protein n=1 Tax=Darwinula stevensoni TaxID=69355 RepID=A0A7R9A905_9CRUS|nr:unnamed protein product [Darwinula stevensoni]CAG0896980.1 unnamed protein product [Darwinula stevensoni]
MQRDLSPTGDFESSLFGVASVFGSDTSSPPLPPTAAPGEIPLKLLFTCHHYCTKGEIGLPPNMEEVNCGEKSQFSPSRARDMVHERLEPEETGGSPVTEEDSCMPHYDAHAPLHLNSSMQTSVPEPYSTQGRAPVHLNMPGGQFTQRLKYESEETQNSHPSHQQYPGVSKSQLKYYMGMACCKQHDVFRCFSSTPNQETPPLKNRQKLKQAVKDYGATVIVFHIGISLVSLSGFYLAVSSGVNMESLLQALGIGQSLMQNKIAAGASVFMIAYAVHKVFAPVRIAITLSVTPFLIGTSKTGVHYTGVNTVEANNLVQQKGGWDLLHPAPLSNTTATSLTSSPPELAQCRDPTLPANYAEMTQGRQGVHLPDHTQQRLVLIPESR